MGNGGSAQLDTKRRCCNSIDADAYTGIIMAAAVVMIILTLVVVTIGTATAPTRDSLFRVAGIATAEQVVGGPGEPGAVYNFQFVLDGNNAAIHFMVQKMDNATTMPSALYIRGPILPFENTGLLLGSLCGFPTTACDTVSIPGMVIGQVVGTIYNGMVPSGIDVRPVIEEWRANPELYYLEILSNGVPVSPGAARAPLCYFSGFA